MPPAPSPWTDLDSNDTITLTPTYNGDISWSAGDITQPLNADQITALTSTGDGKAFSITGVGQDGWQYSAAQNLDFLRQGETITFSFNVVATDDASQANSDSTAQTVTITVTGTNDRPEILAITESASLTEADGAAQLDATGDITWTDLDSMTPSSSRPPTTATSAGPMETSMPS